MSDDRNNREVGLAKAKGTWVQTERSAHEAWAQFLTIRGASSASRILHVLLARMSDQNALVISQAELANILGVDERTVRRSVSLLSEYNWITTRNLGGPKSGVKTYIVNSQVAWQGARGGIRYSEFDAKVHVTEAEQEKGINYDMPLRKIPALYPDEQQLPSGDGLPPPSQPNLPSLEPDLPASRKAMFDPYTGQRLTYDPETGELLE